MAGKTKDVLKDPAAWRAWGAAQIQKDGPPKKKSVSDRLTALRKETQARIEAEAKRLGVDSDEFYAGDEKMLEVGERLDREYRDKVLSEFGETAGAKLIAGMGAGHPAWIQLDDKPSYWARGTQAKEGGFTLTDISPEEIKAWEEELDMDLQSDTDKMRSAPSTMGKAATPGMLPRDKSVAGMDMDESGRNRRDPEEMTGGKKGDSHGWETTSQLARRLGKKPEREEPVVKIEVEVKDSVDLPEEAGSPTTASYRKAGAERLKRK